MPTRAGKRFCEKAACNSLPTETPGTTNVSPHVQHTADPPIQQMSFQEIVLSFKKILVMLKILSIQKCSAAMEAGSARQKLFPKYGLMLHSAQAGLT